MKLYKLLFFLLFLSVSGQVVAQQMSKEERKQWQQAAKDYQKNPEGLKALTDERDRLRREVQQLQARANSAESAQTQNQTQLAQMQQEIQTLRNQLNSAQDNVRKLAQDKAQLEKAQTQTTTTRTADNFNPTQPYAPGVVYRVQVGAFRRNQIPQNFQNESDMTVEEDGGYVKVMLGSYRNYDEAKTRVAALKRQGVKSPWVVAYKDGRRVSLKEAKGN